MEKTITWIRRSHLTLSVAALTVTAYLLILILAESFQNNATYAYLNSVQDPFDVFISLFSPFLHSSHLHLVENLVIFVFFGSLVEKRTVGVQYLGFIIITGLIGNSIVAPLVTGAAVGISSVNYGLKAREVVYRSIKIINGEQLFSKDTAIFVIALFLIVLGFLHPAAGSSYTAHATGLLLGFLWESARLNSFDFTADKISIK